MPPTPLRQTVLILSIEETPINNSGFSSNSLAS
jgi:hypothetical protein